MVEISETAAPLVTLESEVKEFADGLPYWAKYLADKILLGSDITAAEIDKSYSYLLEELALVPATEIPIISISYKGGYSGGHKPDLLFSKLGNVEGVNALSENQAIEFSPKLTIVYGSNGSGKSGYVRLLKKVFYSKSPEEIVQNIYLSSGHKPVSAIFTFQSGGVDIPLKYPADAERAEFGQYAVFDSGSVKHHLDNKNEFEFRPAGLSFFAELTDKIIKVEAKLDSEIAHKTAANEFAAWFDGDSDIKTLVQGLSAHTNSEDVNKHTPFTEKDKEDKEACEKKYDELALELRNKEQEIRKYESIRKGINDSKQSIESINECFGAGRLADIKAAIADCLEKEGTAAAEGIEKFKTDKINNVGTAEWKNFIVAAEKFAKQQKAGESVYPVVGDNCLFCHQLLEDSAQILIKNYWLFIKSAAESDAQRAQAALNMIKEKYEKLNFDLFPAENIIGAWLAEYHPAVLAALKEDLAGQKSFSLEIISDITGKTPREREEKRTSVASLDEIMRAIDETVDRLKKDEQGAELNILMKDKTYLIHKEKFNAHISKFKEFIGNQQWISRAAEINWMAEKRKITDRE